jgi:hypothetical protein
VRLNLQFLYASKKMLECGQGFFVVAQPFNITIEELQVYPSLIFDYHIVKNHTTCHDVFEGFFCPRSKLDTGQLQTEFAKHQKLFQCVFSMLLRLGKMSLFLCLGVLDGLHKS